MATLEFGSVEEFLRNRSYIDKAIDDLQADIAGKLRKYEPEKAEGEREEGAFRAILLRTKKPDANYLIIHVTPNMSKAAYKAICNLDDVALARQLYSVKSKFRQYFNLYIKPKNSALEWKTFCAEHSLKKIAYDCGCKNFTDTALKSIQDCHECDTNNCTECKNLAVDLKKLYLTFLAKTSMEYTPLLAGVAYEIGKRGIPDYSFDWTGHPLIVKHEKIVNLDSKKLRYPDYFSNFIDKELLVQKEFRLMLDIPLVINGKLYGVFVIYPPPEITYEKLPDVLSEMMDVIERRRPDVLRAFFLDVCANIINILSSGGSLDNNIRDGERLIRYSHGIPRTCIISDKEEAEKKAKDLFEDTNVDELISRTKSLLDEEDETLDYFPKSLKRNEKAYNEENPFTKEWHASYKLLKLEKGKKYAILQIYPKKPDDMSLSERLNSLFLTEAIETGLEAYEKKHEIIRHGTKAAMTSIMSRNLSHNIGSHVLSLWIMFLNEMFGEKFLKEKTNEIFQLTKDYHLNGIFPEAIKDSNKLFQYIQHRMDFIAAVSTSIPSSEMTMDFKEDIYNPFIDQKVLLENIASSDGFDDLTKSFEIKPEKDCERVSIPNGIIGRHALYSILENFIRNAAKHCNSVLFNEFDIVWTKMKEQLNSNGSDNIKLYINKKMDSSCLITAIETWNERGGFSKANEFVQVLNCLLDDIELSKTAHENSIELDVWAKSIMNKVVKNNNNVKKDEIMRLNRHIIEKTFNTLIKDTMKFKIELNPYNDRYIELRIWDMREGSCNKEIFERLRKFLDKDSEDSAFINTKGELQYGGWGIKEMIVSANFLRKNPPGRLIDGYEKKEQEPMEIICNYNSDKPVCMNANCNADNEYKNRMGIRFYLRRPKDMCIIRKKPITNGNKFEIDNRDIDISKIATLQEDIPHRLLLVPEKDNLKDNSLLPMRVMTYKESDTIDDNLYLSKYEEFIKNQLNNKNKLPKILLGTGRKQTLQANNNQNASFLISSGTFIDPINGDVVYLIRHPELEKNLTNNDLNEISMNKRYFQPVSGASTFSSKIDNLPKDELFEKHFLLEIIESALTRIIIIDERVNDFAKKDVFRQKKIKEILSLMRIYVIDIDKKNVTKDKITEELEKIKKGNGHKFHFLIIHQGILDKVEKKSQGASTQMWKYLGKMCRWRVIDSGRGVPDELKKFKDARFVGTSAILGMLENYDKHALVQTLFSLRRAPMLKEG